MLKNLKRLWKKLEKNDEKHVKIGKNQKNYLALEKVKKKSKKWQETSKLEKWKGNRKNKKVL